jgi:hypothetical protein
MAPRLSHLAILATLTLAGCGVLPSLSVPTVPTVKERNDFKGKPLSAVTDLLGFPDYQDTIAGQKVYTWRRGPVVQECRIKAIMTIAGDVVESYFTTGDTAVCGPYEARQ